MAGDIRLPSRDQVAQELGYDAVSGLFWWRRSKKGRRGGQQPGSITRGYREIYIFGHGHRAHRLAWLLSYGQWPKGQIDHINCDRADNRLANLREASLQENCFNRRPLGGTSKYKGVHKRAGDRWEAQIQIDGRGKFLGSFPTEDAAALAYDAAAVELFGSFAWLNFPKLEQSPGTNSTVVSREPSLGVSSQTDGRLEAHAEQPPVPLEDLTLPTFLRRAG